MSFLKVLFSNITGFDVFIIVVGLINIILCFVTKHSADFLYEKLHKENFLPSRRHNRRIAIPEFGGIDEDEANHLRKKAESKYAIYTNITAIFPLLGIMGTVSSLLPLVSDLSNMQGNFFAALTSTFWGLVFSIICKFFDGLFLSSIMDENDRSVTLLLENQLNESNESEDVFV